MQPYTDHDTERARQIEAAQAQYPIYQTNQPAPSNKLLDQLTAQRDSRGIAAIGLIVFGVLWFLARLMGGADFGIDTDAFIPAMILFTIASCFFFFAFAKRLFGLFIPAAILTGLAVGIPFADLTNGLSVVWGLALGFGSIGLLGKPLFRTNGFWGFIPASILFVVGTIIAITTLPGLLSLGMVWVPIVLIGAGLYLGWGRSRI
ncbi:hypothetical protein [Herpetosiphon sp. NSE202]|uniref:hypothetical protein n=1 Tax=Herpetosiphon sp. NSE202 TaxID=3351349 RepID=UPI003641DF4A